MVMRRAIPLLLLALPGCTDPDLRLGQTALGLGDYPGAIVALERARARDPEDEEVRGALASAHRSLALGDLGAGRCDAAAGQIAAADTLTPARLNDHQALLDCRRRHGAPPATRLAELERLLAVGDPRTSVQQELMRLYLDQGRQADALRLLDQLERRFGLTTQDRRELAQIFLKQGHKERALQQLLRVKADDPMDPLVRLKIAELFEQQGKIDDASGMYKALVVDYRSNPVVYLRQAEFLRRQGDGEGARRAQDTADRLRGVQPDSRALRELPKSRK